MGGYSSCGDDDDSAALGVNQSTTLVILAGLTGDFSYSPSASCIIYAYRVFKLRMFKGFHSAACIAFV